MFLKKMGKTSFETFIFQSVMENSNGNIERKYGVETKINTYFMETRGFSVSNQLNLNCCASKGFFLSCCSMIQLCFRLFVAF